MTRLQLNLKKKSDLYIEYNTIKCWWNKEEDLFFHRKLLWNRRITQKYIENTFERDHHHSNFRFTVIMQSSIENDTQTVKLQKIISGIYSKPKIIKDS